MNNPSEVYSHVITKAWTDPDFKARLLADPKAALAEHGVQVPDGVKINVHENSDEALHMVLPATPAGEALSEQALEQVAGGTISAIYSCYEFC